MKTSISFDTEHYSLKSKREANIGLYWFLWFQEPKDNDILNQIKQNHLPIPTVKNILKNYNNNEFLYFDTDSIVIDKRIRVERLK